MDKKIEISMLWQIYGALLTEKQKEYIDYYYNEDLSLAEIAQNDGITRQGVRDIIKKGFKDFFHFYCYKTQKRKQLIKVAPLHIFFFLFEIPLVVLSD